MKKLYFALLVPLFMNAQTQIGNDIYPEVAYENSGGYTALSADGQTIVVGGQPTVGDDYTHRFSRARVYTLNEGSWTQKGQSLELTDFNENVFAWCRVAIASDGNTVAIGSVYSGANADQGIVKVFDYVNGQWQQKGQGLIGEAKDFLGYEISLSADGNIMAVVAEGDSDYNDVGSYGYVMTYQFNGTAWQPRGQQILGYYTTTGNVTSFTDMFQGTVSLSHDGNTMVFGCASTSGNVKIFEFDGLNWQPTAEFEPPTNSSTHSFGLDVTISGDGNTVAASGMGYQTGQIKVYQRDNGQWVSKGPTIVGEMNNDLTVDMFGKSLSLSDNGNILAVGVPQRHVPQYNEGRAQVYAFNGGEWLQIGSNIDGVQSNDFFGYDVSLSAAGDYLAVASPFSAYYPYYESGMVKVYGLADILSSSTIPEDLEFSLYPNPAQTTVNIKLPERITLTQVNIYNMLGQLISTAKTDSIDVAALNTGIYYIEAVTSGGSATKAFVKE